MKVILTQDIKKVGKEGQAVEVSDGFARNFLLPRNFAIPATESNMKRVEEVRVSIQRRRKKEREGADLLAERLSSASVIIQAKGGEEGKLFGAVTPQDIATHLKESLGIEIDKKKIHLEEPIKRVGSHQVTVKLDPEVTATLTVQVDGI